mmetsp:Transcript_55063/g.152613  ORF Transcript_55063/g.152613 Transcript_55063/m.152613 type:complete len:248 (+) Transcript_55063:42-785(+)
MSWSSISWSLATSLTGYRRFSRHSRIPVVPALDLPLELPCALGHDAHVFTGGKTHARRAVRALPEHDLGGEVVARGPRPVAPGLHDWLRQRGLHPAGPVPRAPGDAPSWTRPGRQGLCVADRRDWWDLRAAPWIRALSELEAFRGVTAYGAHHVHRGRLVTITAIVGRVWNVSLVAAIAVIPLVGFVLTLLRVHLEVLGLHRSLRPIECIPGAPPENVRLVRHCRQPSEPAPPPLSGSLPRPYSDLP